MCYNYIGDYMKQYVKSLEEGFNKAFTKDRYKIILYAGIVSSIHTLPIPIKYIYIIIPIILLIIFLTLLVCNDFKWLYKNHEGEEVELSKRLYKRLFIFGSIFGYLFIIALVCYGSIYFNYISKLQIDEPLTQGLLVFTSPISILFVSYAIAHSVWYIYLLTSINLRKEIKKHK